MSFYVIFHCTHAVKFVFPSSNFIYGFYFYYTQWLEKANLQKDVHLQKVNAERVILLSLKL